MNRIPVTIKTALILAGFLMNITASTALAGNAEDFPCMDEIEAYCKNVKPGGGKIIECLNGHRKELTPTCLAKVDKALAQFDEAKKICSEDIKTLCGDVTAGEGRILACMKAKKEQLSPPCSKQLDIWGGDNKTSKKVTPGDIKKK